MKQKNHYLTEKEMTGYSLAISAGIELATKLGPMISDWIGRRKNAKLSFEQRLESAEEIIASLGTNLSELGTTLGAIQHALEKAEQDRKKLDSKVKLLSVGFVLMSILGISAVILAVFVK